MESKLFGEFMGTMVLILMGNGVVANVLLKRSKAEGAGWLAITATAWLGAILKRGGKSGVSTKPNSARIASGTEVTA